MSKFSHHQPHNGKPTPAEIFRVFRETTVANISALKLLLDECADLRAELVKAHTRTNDGNGEAHGIFSARQQSRIVELKDAAQAMEALVIALPREANDVFKRTSSSEGESRSHSCRATSKRRRLRIFLPSPSLLAEFRLPLIGRERDFDIGRPLAQRKSCLISQGTDARKGTAERLLEETTSLYTFPPHNAVKIAHMLVKNDQTNGSNRGSISPQHQSGRQAE